MSTVFISPATEADCRAVAACLRPADRAEIDASSGRDPAEALIDARARSLRGGECLVAFDEHSVLALFGVAPTDNPDVGCVWMVGSSGMNRHGRFLHRTAQRYFEQWHRRWPVLWNWTDARNTTHHHWLRALGCSFVQLAPHGVKDLPFYEFIHV